MFTSENDLIEALRRYRSFYDPKTASVLLVGRGNDPHAEPFRAGFIIGVEERAEILKRLALLDARSRQLMVMWHVERIPVARIARALRMSRVHCYRLHREALSRMLDRERVEEPAAV